MSTKLIAIASAIVVTFGLTGLFVHRAPADDVDPNAPEVLTHGPVHEAFAEPTVANPTAPLVVPKLPPAPIEEMPPDVKPEGANVVWIPGYFAWDDQRKDYIWVSGIWRDTPPGYLWVPGYWTPGGDSAQWTPGFWSPAQQQEVNYLPQPPETLEAGPTTPAPSQQDFWVPGNWQYNETRYVWRPGYWTAAQSDWIWTPAHYVWTPSGFVFVPGHWDYSLARRGVMFAPVAFGPAFYERRHYVFAPSVVIDANLLTVNFFVRPRYYHYYFGDYYGDSFVSLGFTPWFSAGVRVGYDPIFTYYRWEHRDDRHWDVGLREHYSYMNTHPEARPPRTFVQQNSINVTINRGNNIVIGATLNQYVKNNNVNGGAKFVAVSQTQRNQLAEQSLRSQAIAGERAKMETSGGSRGTGPTGIGAGGAKTLNLHTLAQNSGGQFSGGTPGTAPATKVGAGISTGRTPAPGSGDPFRMKTGESISSGNSGKPITGGNPTTGPAIGRTPSGNPATGNPALGKPITGNPAIGPSGTPSGRPTTTDPRRTGGAGTGTGTGAAGGSRNTGGNNSGGNNSGRGNKPDDPRGNGAGGPNGRIMNYSPAADSATQAAANAGAASRIQTGTTDPVRPLTLNPGLSAARAQGAADASRELNRAATNPTPAGTGKDPIKPLILSPALKPNPSGGATNGAAGARDKSKQPGPNNGG